MTKGERFTVLSGSPQQRLTEANLNFTAHRHGDGLVALIGFVCSGAR